MGFLSDVRRMNVALTRARRSLWVIGHSGTLEGCAPWRDLLRHCRAQERLYVAGKPYARLLAARSARELTVSGGGGGSRSIGAGQHVHAGSVRDEERGRERSSCRRR